MTGPSGASANRDPQQPPAAADVLSDLMRAGNLLDGHAAYGQELAQALGGITAKRAELEVEREAAEQRIVDDFNARAGALGMERDDLEAKQQRLIARKDRAQKRVVALGGELRELAAAPDAERRTVVAYAAFATTQSDFTGEAVDRLTILDEAVRERADEPFVLVQEGLLAFGRVQKANGGLQVDTSESARRSGIVKLPLRGAKISTAPHARRSPYFGWVSTEFDYPKDLSETYDPVLGRCGKDGDVIKPDGYYDKISRFSIQRGHLPLLRPVEIRLAGLEDVDLEVDQQYVGQTGQEYAQKANIFFTGELAEQFLHKVVGARLRYITTSTSAGYGEAMSELGRLTTMSTKLGIAVNPSAIPELEDLATRQ